MGLLAYLSALVGWGFSSVCQDKQLHLRRCGVVYIADTPMVFEHSNPHHPCAPLSFQAYGELAFGHIPRSYVLPEQYWLWRNHIEQVGIWKGGLCLA
jgi:hypothetical protein